MRPAGIPPSVKSDLGIELEKKFGSFEAFQDEMKAVNMYIQDKGWGWLAYNKKTEELEIRISHGHNLLTDQS